MTPEELTEIIHQGESTMVEFKRCGGLPIPDVYETACSFSNRYGGNIFLGILDDGTIEGVNGKRVQEVQRNLVNSVNNPNLFEPVLTVETEAVTMGDKTVIRVWVPANDSVVRYKHTVYDRSFDVDRKITSQQQLSQMYIRKQNYYSEQRVYPHVTRQELRTDLIAKARKMATLRRPDHPWGSMSDEELLRSARLYGHNIETGESGYNLAAILLLGTPETLASAVPAYRTDALVRRNDQDRYDDRLIVQTPLIEAFEQLAAFARKNLPDRFYLEGDQSVSPRDIIVRELVANMLIHREYSSPLPGRLTIDDQGIHTQNASRSFFSGRLDPSDFSPVSKNPIIADFFLQIGLADELGSGLKNLYKYSRIYSGADPVLTDGDVFTAFVPLSSEHQSVPKHEVSAVSDSSTQDLDTVIVGLLKQGRALSTAEIAPHVSVSERTIRRHLAQLVAQGTIQVAGTRPYKYVLVSR